MFISVVIPLYNKKDSIVRALDSVLNQTILPDEILVINDGSTDGSDELVNEFNHPLVALIHQNNGGVSVARNKGIDFAEHEWIAFLDADDVWKPDYLEEITHLAQSYPECSILATAYEVQDHTGKIKSIILNKIPFEENSGKLTNYFEVASCSQPPLCSSAIVVKKKDLQLIGGFPIGIKSGEDLLTWARLAVKFEIAYSKRNLSIYIQQISNIGSSNLRESIDDPVGELLQNLKLDCPKDKLMHFNQYLSRWFKSKGIILLEIGKNRRARVFLFKALNKSNERFKIMLYIMLSFLPYKISMYVNNNLK